MTDSDSKLYDLINSPEIARQASVEMAILLGIEKALRFALKWMTRDRGNIHKLATLRFHAWSFERYLTRIQVLADHGGYLRVIAEANPHLARELAALRKEQVKLHADLEEIIMRLEQVSQDDADGFGRICTDLERMLDDLRTHGSKEGELLQLSFTQENGGSR